MTTNPDIERHLDEWLGSVPPEAADRVVAAVAHRISVQRQRPAWWFGWSRPRHRELALAVLAIAVALAIVGAAILGSGPSPTPSPSVTRTPTPTAVVPTLPPPPGSLSAGAHSTSRFQPTLSFRVPGGWLNLRDEPSAYTLRQPDEIGLTVHVLSGLAIPERRGECLVSRRSGTAESVETWIDFLTTHPSLSPSTPEPVVVGGHEGQRVIVRRVGTWPAPCTSAPGEPDPGAVLSIDDTVTALTIIDVDGQLLIVQLGAPNVYWFTHITRLAEPVIASFEFAKPG